MCEMSSLGRWSHRWAHGWPLFLFYFTRVLGLVIHGWNGLAWIVLFASLLRSLKGSESINHLYIYMGLAAEPPLLTLYGFAEFDQESQKPFQCSMNWHGTTVAFAFNYLLDAPSLKNIFSRSLLCFSNCCCFFRFALYSGFVPKGSSSLCCNFLFRIGFRCLTLTLPAFRLVCSLIGELCSANGRDVPGLISSEKSSKSLPDLGLVMMLSLADVSSPGVMLVKSSFLSVWNLLVEGDPTDNLPERLWGVGFLMNAAVCSPERCLGLRRRLPSTSGFVRLMISGLGMKTSSFRGGVQTGPNPSYDFRSTVCSVSVSIEGCSLPFS